MEPAKYWIEAMKGGKKDTDHWEREIETVEEIGDIPLLVLMKVRNICNKYNGITIKNVENDLKELMQDKLVKLQDKSRITVICMKNI